MGEKCKSRAGGTARTLSGHSARNILADAWREIQGEPMDTENPRADWWLALPFLLLPAYALVEALL